MAVAAMSSPKISPHAEKGLLEVTNRRALIAVRDEAEHEVGGLGIKRDVSDFVDDDERDERQPAQFGFELALAFGVRELGHPLGGGRERDALAGQARADRDRDGEVCLARARRVVVALLMLWSFCRSGCG